jgi:nucleoside-diphosphate-sugar epimerase
MCVKLLKKSKMSKSILLTGASGFVGHQLAAALNRQNISLKCATRTPFSFDGAPLSELIPGIDGQTNWSKCLVDVDTVIHAAARVHIMKDDSLDPLAEFRKVNVDGTLNLARQAASAGIKRFIFVSSIKVNGEVTTDKPFTASDDPAPIDPYGQSKFEAEMALRELANVTGLEVVIVRPPLVYGPGVRANFLKLMQLVKAGVPLPFGAVHNRRSMVALENLVDLLITCTHHSAAAGKTFMVSDDSDMSIGELVRMLAGAMGRRPILLPVPPEIMVGAASLLGKSAVASRLLGSLQVDIADTKSSLRWQPVVSMQEAVNRTVTHFLSNR